MTVKDVMKKYNKIGAKKTRKKEKKLRMAIQKVNKEKKANTPKPNFPAIQLLHDPQGMSVNFVTQHNCVKHFAIGCLEIYASPRSASRCGS